MLTTYRIYRLEFSTYPLEDNPTYRLFKEADPTSFNVFKALYSGDGYRALVAVQKNEFGSDPIQDAMTAFIEFCHNQNILLFANQFVLLHRVCETLNHYTSTQRFSCYFTHGMLDSVQNFSTLNLADFMANEVLVQSASVQHLIEAYLKMIGVAQVYTLGTLRVGYGETDIVFRENFSTGTNKCHLLRVTETAVQLKHFPMDYI